MSVPETHYAKSGRYHIAYQVFGDGPFDLVMIPGFMSRGEQQLKGVPGSWRLFAAT